MKKFNFGKFTLFTVSTYIFFISIIEYLATANKISIPHFYILDFINSIFLLIGGFIVGIIYLRMAGVGYKILGVFFILNNIVMLRLLLEALV